MASCRRAVLAQATTTDVAELNKKFGIKDHVQIMEGRGGLPMVRLTHSCGASADVYLFGGCVISWKQANGSEVLYVRPDAVFDKSKPISGGIPHCFPQFGPGAMQQHGFARNLDWAIGSTSADVQPDERDPEVELVLTPNDYTTKMWPFKFRAVYTVVSRTWGLTIWRRPGCLGMAALSELQLARLAAGGCTCLPCVVDLASFGPPRARAGNHRVPLFSQTLHGETLKTDFRVINEDTKPFTFTAALHSYFEVADITKAAVRGLKGLSYLDKVADPKNPAKKTETADKITFSGPKVTASGTHATSASRVGLCPWCADGEACLGSDDALKQPMKLQNTLPCRCTTGLSVPECWGPGGAVSAYEAAKACRLACMRLHAIHVYVLHAGTSGRARRWPSRATGGRTWWCGARGLPWRLATRSSAASSAACATSRSRSSPGRAGGRGWTFRWSTCNDRPAYWHASFPASDSHHLAA